MMTRPRTIRFAPADAQDDILCARLPRRASDTKCRQRSFAGVANGCVGNRWRSRVRDRNRSTDDEGDPSRRSPADRPRTDACGQRCDRAAWGPTEMRGVSGHQRADAEAPCGASPRCRASRDTQEGGSDRDADDRCRGRPGARRIRADRRCGGRGAAAQANAIASATATAEPRRDAATECNREAGSPTCIDERPRDWNRARAIRHRQTPRCDRARDGRMRDACLRSAVSGHTDGVGPSPRERECERHSRAADRLRPRHSGGHLGTENRDRCAQRAPQPEHGTTSIAARSCQVPSTRELQPTRCHRHREHDHADPPTGTLRTICHGHRHRRHRDERGRRERCPRNATWLRHPTGRRCKRQPCRGEHDPRLHRAEPGRSPPRHEERGRCHHPQRGPEAQRQVSRQRHSAPGSRETGIRQRLRGDREERHRPQHRTREGLANPHPHRQTASTPY